MENTCVGAFSLQLYEKETPTQVFSCEICEIFKNTYFEEHLWMAASTIKKSIDCYQILPLILSKFNPSQPGVAFLYPPKASEILKVFWCFQGV